MKSKLPIGFNFGHVAQGDGDVLSAWLLAQFLHHQGRCFDAFDIATAFSQGQCDTSGAYGKFQRASRQGKFREQINSGFCRAGIM
jgi:hypothetical protein